MFLMYAVIAVFNSLSVRGRSPYHSLSAQRLSESTVFGAVKYHTAVIIQKLFLYSITALLPKKHVSCYWSQRLCTQIKNHGYLITNLTWRKTRWKCKTTNIARLARDCCAVPGTSANSETLSVSWKNFILQQLVYKTQCAPLYRHWGSVQAVRPTGGVEV